MTYTRLCTAVLACAAFMASTSWAQSTSKLTARELFLTPLPAAKPPTAAKKAPPKQVAAAKKVPARPTPAPPSISTPNPNRPAAPAQEIERELPQVQLASQQDLPEPGDVQFVNASTASALPLALRYSILKYGGDDEAVEVDPDMVFRSGDRIRLRVQVNDTGYLYIVTQGSSGNWRVLFPSAEYDDGNNRVARGRSYDIPKRTRFVFDEQPGEEKLFLVLTRTPEHDLDRLIYQIENPREPAAEEKPGAKPMPTLLAMNTTTVSDDLVGQLRNRLTARDLVFEKVNEDKPRPQSKHDPEKAVYVANPSRESSARLVVDIALKHR